MIKPAPYYKGKGFEAAPIIRYGIPREADSRINKKVIGTAVWDEFWSEQVYRCVHGYTTGGIFIPGRYYYFLNFKQFSTVMGPINAQMCDLHLEIAYWIDHCKQNAKNGIIAKKRRGGISEAFITMVIDYGFRFFPGYQAGVAAGIAKYADEFMKKWDEHNNLVAPEFSLKTRTGDDGEIIASYREMTDEGWKDSGTNNTIHHKTMFQNANLFKGLTLNDICAEEGVEFKNLNTFFGASEACLRFGSEQIGNFFTWGTGGNRSSNGDDFEDMWHNPDDYNMERLFVKGTRFHFPFYGGAMRNGKLVEKLPNLSTKYKDYQLIGVEDEVAAELDIKKVREQKLKSADITKYIEECQNNPLTPEEVFKRVSSNKFSIDVLNSVGFDIASKPKQYAKYKLEYVKNEAGERVLPLKVIAVAAKNLDEEKDCVLISTDGHPREMDNIYCAGIDSYDQDQSKTSKSLGAMCVITRQHGLASLPTMKPVCVIRCRPDRKEKFYEMCLMVSIFYNLVGATLIDHGNKLVIEYYKANGGTRFLARRPAKLESENSEQGHDYGVSLNKHSKPIMVAYMQTAVLDHGNKIVFPNLIDELKAYDEYTVNSDNDLADAYGIAIVQNYSTHLKPRDGTAKDRNKKYLLNDENSGSYGKKKKKNIEQDHDNFGK